MGATLSRRALSAVHELLKESRLKQGKRTSSVWPVKSRAADRVAKATQTGIKCVFGHSTRCGTQEWVAGVMRRVMRRDIGSRGRAHPRAACSQRQRNSLADAARRPRHDTHRPLYCRHGACLSGPRSVAHAEVSDPSRSWVHAQACSAADNMMQAAQAAREQSLPNSRQDMSQVQPNVWLCSVRHWAKSRRPHKLPLALAHV